MRSMASVAACTLLITVTLGSAQAGMGNAASAPHYHPDPCQGDACRADDAKSGLPCQGLLCTFSSAKAMQPPVTAAQSADAQKAAAAVEMVKPIEAVTAEGVAPKRAQAKHPAKANVSTKKARSKPSAVNDAPDRAASR